MKDNFLDELVKISHLVGSRPDFVQGGGGNTSVKFSNNAMAIKASGFNLADIKKDKGIVLVDYEKIKDYYLKNLKNEIEVSEKKGSEFNRSCVLQQDFSSNLRPSIETGFHALLNTYVIHSHSVYANIVCCAKDGEELTRKIFNDSDLKILWLDYFSPGLNLTFGMFKLLNNYDGSGFPDVIFMKNHGLVVTGDSAEKVLFIHKKINETIKKYFYLKQDYPKVKVVKAQEGEFEGDLRFLLDCLQKEGDNIKNLTKNILFPDQIVFCEGNSIFFDKDKGVVRIYVNDQKKAQSIAENIVAYVFIYKTIIDLGLELSFLDHNDIEYIQNMESEKYRKSIYK